jgi:peptide chain release factor 1
MRQEASPRMLDKLATIDSRYSELERLMSDPEVAADYSRVQELAREMSALRDVAALSRRYRKATQDAEEAREISRDESDREMAALAREEFAELEAQKQALEEELRVALLPRDPNDDKNVIVEVRAGTGGEEAGLFAADMYRMYSRYAQLRGWKIEIINSNENGLGSIKEIVFKIDGKGAYSRLKHESGVHRVQRIPVTESGGRIHTSAATVAVLPEAEEVDVEVDPEDLQIDIFHSSGHGGQNVQKVATAVRITHVPTGIAAVCQDERSQHKNKEKAMSVLRSRLLAMEIRKQQEEVSEARRSQVGSGDRSERVRTYNFPQDRVTDHRISLTRHNLAGILDGDIDPFVDALTDHEQNRMLQVAGL